MHLLSDDFYRYPGRPIAPTSPESKHQNETILRAVARAASAFCDGGYDVAIDGVIGPWMLPLVCAELCEIDVLDYVVLQNTLEDSLLRVRERDGEGASASVLHMHRAFAELGEFAGCALDTGGRDVDQVREEFRRRTARGDFRIDPRELAG